MDEIICHPHSGHGCQQRFPVQHIASNDLGGFRHTAVKKLRATRQTAHPMPSLFQSLEQSPTDVSSGPGKEDERLDVGAHLMIGHSLPLSNQRHRPILAAPCIDKHISEPLGASLPGDEQTFY
jgi:hypothetical protein